MEAFILINTTPGSLWKVAEEAEKIDGVTITRAVTGQFDVIIYLKDLILNDVGSAIEKLQSIKGVVKTQTLIVLPQSSFSLS